MKTKLRMRLEIKEITAEGTFEGILSPYGNVDGGNDVVEAGAYDKTLKDNKEWPVLWQHKSDMPIGKVTLESREDGLWAKGQLLLQDPTAQKAYLFIKAGIVKGLSIGFESVKDTVENGIRHLREIKLYECSIVTFPMNEMALITSVKREAGETKDDFNEELSDIQLMDAGWQAFSALQCSLGSIVWASGMDAAQKLSAATAYIQQFSDYYLAYLPLFLEMLAEQYRGMEMMAAKTVLETKSGRMISQANKDSLKSVRDHAANIQTIISALVDDEAGDDGTSKEAAASTTPPAQAAEHKSEPVPDHSAISNLISRAKESYQCTIS